MTLRNTVSTYLEVDITVKILAVTPLIGSIQLLHDFIILIKIISGVTPSNEKMNKQKVL